MGLLLDTLTVVVIVDVPWSSARFSVYPTQLGTIKLYVGNCPFFTDFGDTFETADPTVHLNLCQPRAGGIQVSDVCLERLFFFIPLFRLLGVQQEPPWSTSAGVAMVVSEPVNYLHSKLQVVL